jgi:alkanesulfonate monooxygenase SsuD/methylene tetrahydromethanopterin reductase-like flavin-dependent oxidoreductase (luciferase family)
MRSDYEAAGIALDRPGLRIERLAETVSVLKALFGGESVTFKGEHVQVHDLVGVPATVQQPHPPFLIGGGGRRMLRFAGGAADIVGVNANLSAGDIGGHSVLDVSWERMEEKVGWVREGAIAAGRDPDELELSMAQWLLHITESPSDADALLTKLAPRLGVDPAWLEDSPGVLVGSVQRVIEKLETMRDRLGISYIQLHSGPTGVDLEPAAPVIAALAGT